MKTNYFKQALATLALLLLATAAHAYDVEINGIYYNLVPKAKQATVTYTGEDPWNRSSYSGAIQIPATVDKDGVTYTVTAIGDNAFYGAIITSIDIPNTVTSIGDYAFNGCSSLASVTIPNSVASIGSDAFVHCI
ncbi:MAG: leucine-rich repeat domain-containing protein [Bacteroidaceae bacterium]|nr:leucine-rich repeat domain-containing protein [Bacteroidaceae bacterium]